MPAASSPRVLSRATWPNRSSCSARKRASRWCQSVRTDMSATALPSIQPSIASQGSSLQATTRSARTSNGWLGEASVLRNP